MSCEKDEKKENPSFMKEAEAFLSKGRKLFLWGGVDDESAEKLVKQMLYLDSLSHDDIYLFINSPGGIITSGLAVYDCMQSIESDVVTICAGQAASFGAVLLCAGAKGKRYAWPNARILIHQPLIHGEMVAPASDLQIQAEEMLRTRQVLNEIIGLHCGKDPSIIEKDTDRDNFMSAEEAKIYGLVDAVKNVH
jgi:ATP-dependent Clp protease, protease subunit